MKINFFLAITLLLLCSCNIEKDQLNRWTSYDESYEIKENSCVFTHGALEQLAGNVKNIINFFLHKKPTICIHIEPTVEFYDEDNLFDYLQIKFHKKRGYSSGYLPYLQQLDKKGQINITDRNMTRFNIALSEGVDMVIWSIINSIGGEIFVPKIPSYRILDVADAISPSCKKTFSGI